MNIVYKIDTSTQADILSHLTRCDKDFISNINKKISTEDYSKKLFVNAMRFEAWDNEALVGLIAIYINKDNFAYLTNVSIANNYRGQQIASELLRRCIKYTQEQKLAKIKLEVNKQNVAAIKLYEKYNFKVGESDKVTQFMELGL